MADDPSAPTTQDPSPQPDNPIPQSQQPDPPPASTPFQLNNPNPNPPLVSLPPPSVSYAPQPVSAAFAAPPSAPSFRPVPQFSPVPNYQTPGVPPPGVSSVPGAPVPVPVPQHMMHYQMQQPMRGYAPMPNGYSAPPQGTVPPPGLIRYPSPYPTMVRPGFPSRPPGGIGMLPSIQRPPMLGIPGVRPIMPPVVRPAVPSVTPAEKPQTTVFVGKIAPTVNNDFILYLLQLCGPVKLWKRAQDPTDGTPRGFGFCEFESAEGVLRALRLLSKFNIDGQELVLNVKQATREYLERFVEKKTAENTKKLKDSQAEGDEKEGQSTIDKTVVPNSVVDLKEEDNNSGNKESISKNFGIVTDEDKEADRVALEKLTSLIEERLKTNPLPPPPPLAPGNSISESPSNSRDGDPNVDIARNDASGDKNDEETTSDNKAENEQDRPETSSPERSRKPDKSRERDRERDVKQEKEREIERYERETERERIRKEREQRRKFEDAERKFEECLKDWEYREREKQKQRQKEKEREKEWERKRKKEVINEEDDDEEDSRKRWRRTAWEEKKKKRQREKEEDLADRLKEEEEIAEANRRADEEKQLQQLRDALKASSTDAREKADLAEESCVESEDMAFNQDNDTGSGHENHIGDGTLQNGNTGDESAMTSEPQQSGSAPAKKLGFGLVGSGKRASVPSVFKEEDDDAHKDKKMRPLVPIDYSTEELQAVEPAVSGQAPPNLAAAAEFAKRISTGGSKEEKYEAEKERNRRANDRSSQRDRDRKDDDSNRTRDENKTIDRDTDREHARDKPRTMDNKKLLDAKQLIDMIPKTKEELFSYEINWAIYEKHALHERMKPWISRKITEFLGEEETTLVDYIVSSTQEHVGAERMLQLLQSILDEEAEMFVLKMWRMLIFEIKKVETGLPSKTRS